MTGLAGAAAPDARADPAASWPDKPVKIIINFAPGGGTDNAIRPFTEPLHRALGQPFVLEHKGGASGAIGLEAGVKSRPDGYTFFASPSLTLVVLPHVRKVPYDTFKDVVPVSYATWYPMMLSVHPTVPVATLQEFVAYAKANPDKLSLGSSGIGTTGHLIAAGLNQAAGITVLHVPYRGSADALNDFLAGVVQVFADPTVAPHVRAGKARLIAVTGARHPEYPDIPSLADTYPEANFVPWNALFAPVGTPDAIVRKLSAAMDRIARTPEMAEFLLKVGQFPGGGTPETLATALRHDYDRYGAITKALDIKAE
jgi:tripartite-type tricarboxylate transporter receptor subunit TctC